MKVLALAVASHTGVFTQSPNLSDTVNAGQLRDIKNTQQFNGHLHFTVLLVNFLFCFWSPPLARTQKLEQKLVSGVKTTGQEGEGRGETRLSVAGQPRSDTQVPAA